VYKSQLQAFPFPSSLGEVTLHLLSLACVFVYRSHGKWVFPPLLWSFPPTAAFTRFPAPDCWAVLLLLPAAVFVYSSHGRWVFPTLLWSFPPSTTLTSFPTPGYWAHTPASAPEPLRPGQLVYLQFWEGFPLPLFATQCAPPSLQHVFIVLIAYYSVSLFTPDGGRSVQGAMLFWPRVVCGSTVVSLSSPCPCLPKPSGCRRLVARGPSWFLCLV
jgi:hypothetical protein